MDQIWCTNPDKKEFLRAEKITNLASTLMNQERWKEAEEPEVQVIERSARVFGEGHLGALTSMANLARTLKSQSRNEEASSLMEKRFQLYK